MEAVFLRAWGAAWPPARFERSLREAYGRGGDAHELTPLSYDAQAGCAALLLRNMLVGECCSSYPLMLFSYSLGSQLLELPALAAELVHRCEKLSQPAHIHALWEACDIALSLAFTRVPAAPAALPLALAQILRFAATSALAAPPTSHLETIFNTVASPRGVALLAIARTTVTDAYSAAVSALDALVAAGRATPAAEALRAAISETPRTGFPLGVGPDAKLLPAVLAAYALRWVDYPQQAVARLMRTLLPLATLQDEQHFNEAVKEATDKLGPVLPGLVQETGRIVRAAALTETPGDVAGIEYNSAAHILGESVYAAVMGADPHEPTTWADRSAAIFVACRAPDAGYQFCQVVARRSDGSRAKKLMLDVCQTAAARAPTDVATQAELDMVAACSSLLMTVHLQNAHWPALSWAAAGPQACDACDLTAIAQDALATLADEAPRIRLHWIAHAVDLGVPLSSFLQQARQANRDIIIKNLFTYCPPLLFGLIEAVGLQVHSQPAHELLTAIQVLSGHSKTRDAFGQTLAQQKPVLSLVAYQMAEPSLWGDSLIASIMHETRRPQLASSIWACMVALNRSNIVVVIRQLFDRLQTFADPEATTVLANAWAPTALTVDARPALLPEIVRTVQLALSGATRASHGHLAGAFLVRLLAVVAAFSPATTPAPATPAEGAPAAKRSRLAPTCGASAVALGLHALLSFIADSPGSSPAIRAAAVAIVVMLPDTVPDLRSAAAALPLADRTAAVLAVRRLGPAMVPYFAMQLLNLGAAHAEETNELCRILCLPSLPPLVAS
eukprot:m.253249 g.253249  ORF g.253249 m.253249 type:complete len:790 (-) comp18240_c0_seq1:288-2657(-)